MLPASSEHWPRPRKRFSGRTRRWRRPHWTGPWSSTGAAGLYEDWIFPEREHLHQQCTRALERLAHLLEDGRDYAGAIRCAERLLQHDPLHEPSYRLLMRLHALAGDRAGAVRVYRTCTEVLQRELDLEPEPATRALYERLMGDGEVPLQEERSQPMQPPRGSAAELPLVGRRRAWAWLRQAWHTAAEGRAQLLTICGVAGIGKTRLAEDLLTWAARQGLVTARARSYAAEGRLAYAPVTEWLRAAAIRPHLAHLDAVWLSEVVRLLPELRIEHPELPEPGPLMESWQRQRFFEALARAILAAGRPLLLLLDDMQWSDQDTLEWLRFMLRFAPEARLLIVGTVRSEEVDAAHPLHALLLDLGRTAKVTEVALEPLSEAETAQLATHVAGRALSEAQATLLYGETEGNPLFVVESVRAGLPSAEPTVQGRDRLMERALALCRDLEVKQRRFSCLWGLWTFRLVRAELEALQELTALLLRMAEEQPSNELSVAAHLASFFNAFFLGALPMAREHMDEAFAQPAFDRLPVHIFLMSADERVFCHCCAAHVLWFLGYPDQALQHATDALELADASGHPFNRAIARCYAAMLHQYRREHRAAEEHAKAAAGLCDEHGFAYYGAWCMIVEGWALAERGAPGEGKIQMRRGLDQLKSTGAVLREPYYLALLAEACARAGQIDQGLELLTRALEAAERRGEHWIEAELYRLRGELLLARDAEGEAETHFRQAEVVAARQQARSLELRAAMRLARLWHRQGKTAEARHHLEQIYSWFTEGHDTPDLREAAALLTQWS